MIDRETLFMIEKLLKHSQTNEDGTAVMVDKQILEKILRAAGTAITYHEMYKQSNDSANKLDEEVRELRKAVK